MTRVLLVHERPSVLRAVEHVLRAWGVLVHGERTVASALGALRSGAYDALLVDVALPRVPGVDLIEPAKELSASGRGGAKVVILVTSAFRKSSYKRRPVRLYGAHDYVELHDLGDTLPAKLARWLHIERPSPLGEDPKRLYPSLASWMVADAVLYNSDTIVGVETADEARSVLRDDLEVSRDLMRQVLSANGAGGGAEADEAIERAFEQLMSSMGRVEVLA